MSDILPAANAQATHRNGVVLISLSVLFWSMGGLFTRLLPFDLWTIIFWRGVFATVFIGAYALYVNGTGIGAAIKRSGGAGILVMLCSAATIILFPAAFQTTSVANAFTMIAVLPFITAAIAWAWLGERPSGLTLAASALAMLGLFIMVGPYSGGVRLGDAYAMAGTVAQAVMIVGARRHPSVAMLPMAWLAIIFSVLIAYPLAQHTWDLAPRDYVTAAGFGLLPMTLGMMLYVIGSALIPAALSALIGLAEAPLGAFWAWAGIGEVPAMATIVGGGIVLASVILRLMMEQWRAQD